MIICVIISSSFFSNLQHENKPLYSYPRPRRDDNDRRKNYERDGPGRFSGPDRRRDGPRDNRRDCGRGAPRLDGPREASRRSHAGGRHEGHNFQKARENDNRKQFQAESFERSGDVCEKNAQGDTSGAAPLTAAPSRPRVLLLPRSVPVESMQVRNSANPGIFGEGKARDEAVIEVVHSPAY